MKRGAKPVSLLDRFWEKVRVGDGCWEWTAAATVGEYGQIGTRKRALYAHRVSWEIANRREIPVGLLVRHTCDNPLCVRPDHLELGTDADNKRDYMERGYVWRERCRRGHSYENAYVRRGRRNCRECAKITRRVRLTKVAA